MRTYTVTKYEEEDFDAVRENMTIDKAIKILEGLPDGWFTYRMPSWSDKVCSSDLHNYEICCAIWAAIALLKEREEE